MLVGDPTLSVMEIWGAEYQENNALLLKKEDEALFAALCSRENCPFSVVGTVSGDGRVVVEDSRDGTTAVDLPLALVLGALPPKVQLNNLVCFSKVTTAKRPLRKEARAHYSGGE